MICETCHGIGEVLIDRESNVVSRLRDTLMMMPCPDCIGGHAHCCDGLREQPEPSNVNEKWSSDI